MMLVSQMMRQSVEATVRRPLAAGHDAVDADDLDRLLQLWPIVACQRLALFGGLSLALFSDFCCCRPWFGVQFHRQFAFFQFKLAPLGGTEHLLCCSCLSL